MFRFVAFVFNPQDKDQREQVRAFSDRLFHLNSSWQTLATSPEETGLRILCNDASAACGYSLVGPGYGAVLGTLFERSSDPHVSEKPALTSLSARASERILASDGRVLVSDYWGRYV